MLLRRSPRPAGLFDGVRPGAAARARLWLQRKAHHITARKGVAVLILAGVSWVAYQQLAFDALILEPFIVPPRYAELGWTGETMSRRVRQELYALDRLARQSRNSLQASAIDLRFTLPTDIPAMSKIEVPGTGANVAIVAELIREAFNRSSPRVQGEVVMPFTSEPALSPPVVELTIRLATSSGYRVLPPIIGTDPGMLARCAAERVLHDRNPLLFGLVLYDKQEFEAGYQVVSALTSDPEWLSRQSAGVRSEAFNLLGNILVDQKKYADAMDQYGESIKLDPNNRHPYVNQAMAHHRWARAGKGRVEAEHAVALYKRALEMAPADRDNSNIYVNIGLAYQDIGDLDLSIAMYKEALAADAGNVNALINWGVAYGQRGKFNEAIEKFQEALAKAPRNPDAYGNWGYALGVQGHFKNAYEKFAQAAALAPNYSAIYTNWAEILTMEGATEEANNMRTKASELDTVAAKSRPRLACAL